MLYYFLAIPSQHIMKAFDLRCEKVNIYQLFVLIKYIFWASFCHLSIIIYIFQYKGSLLCWHCKNRILIVFENISLN